MEKRCVSSYEHRWEGFGYSSRMVTAGAGGRDVLLLVGGAFQCKESWGRLEQGLLDSFDVLTVDLPGWGDADTLPASYDVDFLADALVRILDDLSLDQVAAVGGSYGSAIAFRLAQAHPDRVTRLVLVGTMGTIAPGLRTEVEHTLDLLARSRLAEFADATLRLFMDQDERSPVTNRQEIERILRNRFSSITADEADKYLHNTRRLLTQEMIDPVPSPAVPVLVFTGEHDRFTSPESSRAVAAACSDAWFATIADCDHMAHLERSAECADLITRFVLGKSLLDLGYCRRSEAVIKASDAVQRTSDLVAEIRARECDHPDPYLEDFTARLFTSPLSAAQIDAGEALGAPFEPVIVRGRLGELRLEQAIEQGIVQVVSLAAGGDTRMWRARVPAGMTYFELDLPGRLEGKARLLADAGFPTGFSYHPIEADLLDDWLPALLDAGYDRARPAYWIVEGITWYLRPGDLERLLATVSDAAAPGSLLTVDLTHRDFLTQPDLQPFLAAMRALGSSFTEGLADPLTFLDGLGWQTTPLWYPHLGPHSDPAIPERLTRSLPMWLVTAAK